MFGRCEVKALEILKNCRNRGQKRAGGICLDEAIAELEEAMKPKTCDGCKQSWEPNNQTFHKYFCEYLKIPVHGCFYCNRYEPKDNA